MERIFRTAATIAAVFITIACIVYLISSVRRYDTEEEIEAQCRAAVGGNISDNDTFASYRQCIKELR